MYEEAYELASQGLTNAEIFGKLELTSGALMALMQTQPQLLFQILNGREAYCKGYREIIEEFAAGQEPITRTQYTAAVYVLERAETQNKQLTIGHEMILLAGSPEQVAESDMDSKSVTALLRKHR